MNPDTTAQLRHSIERIIGTAILKNDKNYTNDAMQAIADYISQLELPEKYVPDLEPPDIMAFKAGFNKCIENTASTLQKAVEELRK